MNLRIPNSYRLFSSTTAHERQPSIAIIGGGLTGCAAAQEFARKGYRVDLFETGRGVGGRTSTRRIGEFSFDHGYEAIVLIDSKHFTRHCCLFSAQYITLPKTGTFQKLLLNAMETGTVKPWEGNFGKAEYQDGKIIWNASKLARYVGVPSMNAICKLMVSNPLITCHFSCPVQGMATKENGKLQWHLKTINGSSLGIFDWLVVGDRAAAANMINQSSSVLNSFGLKQLAHSLQDVYSPIPCLSLMVALKSGLPKSTFPYDSVSFKGSPILGWISRDSSKPGRERSDGQECWNIQSNPDFAKSVIK